MVTSGIFGFRYKDIYYVFYNKYDSYFSHLGINLLREIKIMIDNNNLDNWISKINNLKIVTNNYNNKNNKNNIDNIDLFNGNFGSYESVLNNGYIEIDKISKSIEKYNNDISIEWLYILDIDKEEFYFTNFKKQYNITLNDIITSRNINEFYIDDI